MDRLTSAAAATERLAAAGCVAAEDEAEELVAAAPDPATLDAWLARREQGEPLAWIIGAVSFCGHRIAIGAGVYVPRVQSEELARRAAVALAACPDGRAVDLCTGAGAVAVHLTEAVPSATVVGVDIDRAAARCARRNGVPTVLADLDAPLRSGAFDVVTAVAPYVPTEEIRLLPADVQRYEPRLALDGGGDGLDLVRRVISAAARLLRRDGQLLIEIGGHQDHLLAPALAEAGFGAATAWFDDEGDLRGLVARAGPWSGGRW